MKAITLKTLSAFLVVFLINSCGNDDTQMTEEEILEEVLVEVVFFEFQRDTGNDSQRLRYEISFTNPNDRSIRGGYEITTNADGLVTTQISSTLSPCTEIDANSSCTVTFDEEEPFESGLATVQSIELVSVEYTIVE